MDASITNIFDLIKTRRSVRKFKPDPVPDEHLELILDAARYAPTAGNNQPWSFLVLCERENLSRLRKRVEAWTQERIQTIELNPTKQAERLDGAITYLEGIFAAPLIIFIFVDTSAYPELVAYDGALAAGYLMLAARALGYGTCFQTTYFPDDIIREHFSVPERFRLICAIPLGLSVEWPPTPPKKPLQELVHRETF
jgi:nitroreductase